MSVIVSLTFDRYDDISWSDYVRLVRLFVFSFVPVLDSNFIDTIWDLFNHLRFSIFIHIFP